MVVGGYLDAAGRRVASSQNESTTYHMSLGFVVSRKNGRTKKVGFSFLVCEVRSVKNSY